MAMKDSFEPDVLRLVDDTGEETAYEILDVISYAGDEYAVLFPMEGEDCGAVILRIIPAEQDEAETYVGVDEVTMNAVFQAFREQHRDELQG